MKFKAKKFFAWLGAVVAAVLVVLVLVLEFAAGPVVKHAAAAAGPLVLGTEIAISNADIHVFSGKIDMGGVVIGPPEGFDANLFELESIHFDMDTVSLLGSGPIVIHDISIERPVVTYELKGLHDNLHALLDKLGASEEKKEAKSGRKVVIEHFKFEGGRVHVALVKGHGPVVPLPTIELSDIGRKSGGATAVEVTFDVLQSIVVGVLSAVGEVVGDVGGLAVDGVKAVGGAAVDGAKAVGGAAVDGVKSVGKAIGGLFSSDDGAEGDGASAAGDASGEGE